MKNNIQLPFTNRRHNFETVLFNGIEAIVKNPIEQGLFPLTEDQKEYFISNSKDGINQVIHSAIISYGYANSLNNFQVESECIGRHSSKLVEFMSNLKSNKYTDELNSLARAFAMDISNLFTDA